MLVIHYSPIQVSILTCSTYLNLAHSHQIRPPISSPKTRPKMVHALARASAALRAPRGVGELWALEASWPLATGPTALAGVVGVAVLDRGAPGLDVAADLAAAAVAFAALRPGLPFLDDPPTAAVPPGPGGGSDDDDDGLDGLDEVLAGLSGGASPEG